MFVNFSVISSMFSIIICIMILLLSISFSGALEENFKTSGILWTSSILYIKLSTKPIYSKVKNLFMKTYLTMLHKRCIILMLSATITNGLINIFTPLTTHENMSKISKVHKWPMCCGKSEQSLAQRRRRLSK